MHPPRLLVPSLAFAVVGATVSLSPLAYLGVLFLAAWLILQLSLLSWADLTSVTYVLTAVLGAVTLHEHVSIGRWTRRGADLRRRPRGRPYAPSNRARTGGKMKWWLVLTIVACNGGATSASSSSSLCRSAVCSRRSDATAS
jgi:hypothetical protein